MSNGNNNRSFNPYDRNPYAGLSYNTRFPNPYEDPEALARLKQRADYFKYQDSIGNIRKGGTGEGMMTTTIDLVDALTGKEIDDVSKAELGNLFANQGGAGVSKYVAAAKAGKGIFAVRKINQAEQDLLKAMPGRNQVVSSTGYGSAL